MFEDLKEKYNISYLLTCRLNQDPLEGFFSIIRAVGGLHDHPTPLEFKCRLRNYFLGRNRTIVSQSTNVQQDIMQNETMIDPQVNPESCCKNLIVKTLIAKMMSSL